MAYTRGNLAVKEKVAERTSPGYREKTKVVTHRTYLPIKEKLLYLLTVGICVMVASLIIWQNANIYDLNKQGQKVDKNIKNMNVTIKELKAEKQRLEVGIREKAIQLGFQEPGKEALTVPRSSTISTDNAGTGSETAKK